MMRTINRGVSRSLYWIRAFACLSIMACHFLGSIPRVAFLGQIFNVGTGIFFLISGYLQAYHSKEKNYLDWLRNRLIKILIPYYIYCLFIIIAFSSQINLRQILSAIFNLQGFTHAYLPYSGHLWYLSIMVFCYVLTPLLEKITESKKRVCILFGLVYIIAIPVATWGPNHRIRVLASYTHSVMLYLLGMLSGKSDCLGKTTKPYRKLTVLMLATNVMRLGFIWLTDHVDNEDFNNFYTYYLSHISHAILAIWICITIYIITTKWEKLTLIYDKPIMFIAHLSYEIYIMHNILLYDRWNMTKLTKVQPINAVVFLLCSIVLAFALSWISQLVRKPFQRR